MRIDMPTAINRLINGSRPARRPAVALALVAGLTLSLAADQKPLRSASAAVVNVQVLGLRNNNGVLKAALFNSAAAWSADKANTGAGALQRLDAPIRSGSATLSFAAVPYGTYAIKAFHDEDRSGKFYTGLFGIPKVEVAFSNNAPINKGQPSFDKASVQLNQPYMTLVLRAQRM